MAALAKYELETTFINTCVETGAYSLVVTRSMAATLRDLRVDLVDVNYLLRTGFVVRSDMDESRGLWDVRGKTVDGMMLEIRIAVISSIPEVELLQIISIERR